MTSNSSDLTRNFWRSRTGSFLRIALTSYAGLLLLIAGCQRSYIYYPRRLSEPEALAQAAREGLQPWRTGDGSLIGWRTGGPDPIARRVLVFHGNAGSAADRGYFADIFAAQPAGIAWRTYILEYPGYGSRPGRPSERAFRDAAREALDALIAESAAPVLLLGESLGGGVACRLAAERSEAVTGVLLLTPFTSLTEVAASHYPFLPVGLFLRDRYDNATALRGYTGPVAIVIADRDEVIPARLGRALHDGYLGPKRLFEQPDAGHNTLDLDPSARWWEDALRFLAGE